MVQQLKHVTAKACVESWAICLSVNMLVGCISGASGAGTKRAATTSTERLNDQVGADLAQDLSGIAAPTLPGGMKRPAVQPVEAIDEWLPEEHFDDDVVLSAAPTLPRKRK